MNRQAEEIEVQKETIKALNDEVLTRHIIELELENLNRILWKKLGILPPQAPDLA